MYRMMAWARINPGRGCEGRELGPGRGRELGPGAGLASRMVRLASGLGPGVGLASRLGPERGCWATSWADFQGMLGPSGGGVAQCLGVWLRRDNAYQWGQTK